MRPSYGDAFKFEKILNVFFYTSNIDKLMQARLVFQRYGYALRHFKGEREPYDEDYSMGTEFLLKRAIAQVNREFGVRSIFFVEDTSVRIEALSSESDFPGLSVKEWFRTTTFSSLDEQVRAAGGSRKVIVKSDIALYLPTLSRPLMYHGETHGQLALTEPTFEPSAQYPWLTPSTFNGWFIPEGTQKRLGEMEIEESLQFDFRVKSLRCLIEGIEALNAALNIGQNFYKIRRSDPQQATLPLPLAMGNRASTARHIWLIIGAKCAGKTTMSDYLITREDVTSIEASSILRGLAQEKSYQICSGDDALSFLQQNGMDLVAREIERAIIRGGGGLFVVTGLRTVEELTHLTEKFPEAQVILIDCDLKTRFERHIRRGRDVNVNTLKAFQSVEDGESRFGAFPLKEILADIVIRNDSALFEFMGKIEELLAVRGSNGHRISGVKKTDVSELYRCLRALADLGVPSSCEEISAKTAQAGAPVRKYNTNRALKPYPALAKRIETRGDLLRYEITPAGRNLLGYLANAMRRRS